MLWVGRGVVAAIAIVAFIIASSPECKGIMALVECAWAGFGSAFGPTIILALYWKRFTYKGAVAGIISGVVTDALCYMFFSGSVEGLTALNTGVYEIIPGFIVSMIVAVVASLMDKEPSKEIEEMFEKSKKPVE